MLEIAFVDGATCDVVDFGHQVEIWRPQAQQPSPVCPFMPLLGRGLDGWGNYDLVSAVAHVEIAGQKEIAHPGHRTPQLV